MCSPFGIRDFPIQNSVPVTSSLNAMIYEEFPLDIQWGPKATPPEFIHDGQYANLGFIEYMNAGASSTTLRLNGNSFSLISVQLCSPQHKSLVETDKQNDVAGEIILGFKAQNVISESYLFVCVPVITRYTWNPSKYLEALRLGQLDGQPTSLLSVLPENDKHFISYSTCLQRRESSGTSAKQARVFVFIDGLYYPNDKFQELIAKIAVPKPQTPSLPTVQLPDSLMDKTQAMLFSIATETDYKSLLRYSQYYPQGTPSSSKFREDNLNSYKCVPLEPSQNVKDGKIIVDTESGELLSQVLKDKDEQGRVKNSKLSPALVEKILAVCIAILLVAFVFLIVGYIITNITTPNADSFFGVIAQHKGTISSVVFFSTLAGVICFVLGFFLQSML